MNRRDVLFLISLNLLLALFLLGAFSTKTVHATAPYLVFVQEYYYAPLLDSNPEGRFNLILDITKLMYDASSGYDWYFYSNIPVGAEGIRMQTVPGKVAYAAYGSDWENAHIYSNHVVWLPGTDRWLVDYDPTTTNGWDSDTATASVTVTPGGGGAGLSQSYSYGIPWMRVDDYSDFNLSRASWQHNFNTEHDPHGGPSETTFLVRPAFVVKTTEYSWSLVNGNYQVEFGDSNGLWWDYHHFDSSTLFLDAYMPGDVPTSIETRYYRSDSWSDTPTLKKLPKATSLQSGSVQSTKSQYYAGAYVGAKIYINSTLISGADPVAAVSYWDGDAYLVETNAFALPPQQYDLENQYLRIDIYVCWGSLWQQIPGASWRTETITGTIYPSALIFSYTCSMTAQITPPRASIAFSFDGSYTGSHISNIYVAYS